MSLKTVLRINVVVLLFLTLGAAAFLFLLSAEGCTVCRGRDFNWWRRGLYAAVLLFAIGVGFSSTSIWNSSGLRKFYGVVLLVGIAYFVAIIGATFIPEMVKRNKGPNNGGTFTNPANDECYCKVFGDVAPTGECTEDITELCADITSENELKTPFIYLWQLIFTCAFTAIYLMSLFLTLAIQIQWRKDVQEALDKRNEDYGEGVERMGSRMRYSRKKQRGKRKGYKKAIKEEELLMSLMGK